MGKYIIRLVKDTDAIDILRIYEPYVKETAISFEYEVASLEKFKKRIQEISADYPYIVCLVDGTMAGYAYAHRQMNRAAYQWNAELSIYVANSYQHCGVGKILYSALMEILKLQNIRNVYGCITASNENSIRFHEYLGFKKCGIFHNTGYKCGMWQDVVWLEKALGEYELNPKAFISIKDINSNAIMKVLNNYSCN